jgi:hypothetical protein
MGRLCVVVNDDDVDMQHRCIVMMEKDDTNDGQGVTILCAETNDTFEATRERGR